MKYIKPALLVLFSVFFAVCVAIFCIPQYWAVYGEHTPDCFIPLQSLTIVKHYGLVHFIAILFAFIFLMIVIISLWIKKIPFRWCLWLLPFLYCVICVKESDSFSVLDPWTCHGSVKDSAGNIYWFLDQSFLQGQTMAIGRLRKTNIFMDEFEVLVATNGDSPQNYLHITRPDGSPEGYGQLYLSKDNWLVGVRCENLMFLAYDLNSKKPFAGDHVETLSPFLLIEENTALNPVDCTQIQQVGIGERVGQPREETIQAAFNHANPEVRAFAKKLLDGKKVD
jgi:hypothetical protein